MVITVERDKAKGIELQISLAAQPIGKCIANWEIIWLNWIKRSRNYTKNDSKKLWSTLNYILGKKANSDPSFIESDGFFITKPNDIANYFNDFFIGKISKRRDDMPATNADTTHPSISDQIMKNKHCYLEFRKVSVE